MSSKRRRLGLLVLALPTTWIVLDDWAHRYRSLRRLGHSYHLAYAGSALASLLLWGVLLHAASRRRGAVSRAYAAAFVALYGLVTSVQGAFRGIFDFYCGLDAVVYLRSLPRALYGDLPFWRATVVGHYVLGFGLATTFVCLARARVRPRPRRWRVTAILAPLLLLAMCAIPASYHRPQASLPDQLYFHGLAAAVTDRLGVTDYAPLFRPTRREPDAVPKLERRGPRRNVLLVLQESQRFDVSCVRFTPDCALATPFSNKAAPARLPLLQMRSNDSSTAVTMATLWSGLAPNAAFATFHRAPLLFDYAKAAGFEADYWTSQHLVFEGFRAWLADSTFDRFVTGTSLDGLADFDYGADDAKLTDRVIEDFGDLKEPFFAVVHYSNQHYPYLLDPNDAPFVPYGTAPPERNSQAELYNYYKNVVYRSDKQVGRLLDVIKASDKGKRTVVVYTADHGESLMERGGWGHTWSILEEQVHVPTWIDAPEGTLTPEEEESLRGAESALAWHLDLSATLLDLLGVWDDPELSPFRKNMMGHPLTRKERTVGPVPMTNCTWVWECKHPNWGLMLGTVKLMNSEYDRPYRCYDLATDPGEQRRSSPEVCKPALEAAKRLYLEMDATEKPWTPLPPPD